MDISTHQMRFRGFISYSQKDARIAHRLHRALEAYRLPRSLHVHGTNKRKLGRFFLDKDETSASEDLGAMLEGALQESECLIVVASPYAAASKWVDKEIQTFQRRSGDRVLAVIASGKPNADDPLFECFPPALRGVGPMRTSEPAGADLTKESFNRVLLRTVAGILEIPFDSLWQREKRRRNQQRAIAMATTVLAAVAVFAVNAQLQANFDQHTLVRRAVNRSLEGWQNAWRPAFFSPAMRAALAASSLNTAEKPGGCNLSLPVENAACALRLSGLSLKSSLIFGKMPSRDQDNIRIDIPDSDTFQRRMITGSISVRDVNYAAGGARIGFISDSGTLAVYDLRLKKMVASERMSAVKSPVDLALNATGTVALVLTGDNHLTAFNIERKTTQILPSMTSGHITDIEARRDHWIVLTNDGDLVLLDASFQPVWRHKIIGTGVYNTEPLAAKRDKIALFQGDFGTPQLELIDLNQRTSEVIESKDLGAGVGQVKALALSPDARLVALGGNGSGGGSRAGVQIFDLKAKSEKSRLVGHHGEVYAIAFFPNGLYVATGGSDYSIRIWDTTSGVECLRLIGHVAPIYSIAVSPDGSSLVSSSWDGTVRKWDIPPAFTTDTGALRSALCQHLPDAETSISTLLPTEERRQSDSFKGRPWDVCSWRGLNSIEGWQQAIRVAFVRWLGIQAFDPPPPTAINRD